MDTKPHYEPDYHCPQCGAEQRGGDQLARCLFCGGELMRGNRGIGQGPVLKALIWVARGYRTWSLGVFAVAVMNLLRIGDVKSLFFGFVVLYPFALALGISFLRRAATSKWIVAFLVLVDLGVILAPAHHIFPWLNMFPEIPRTQNRILSWYFLVYITLQYVVAPPVAFTRSLHAAWHGCKPVLSSWICVFGLLVWGLFVSVLSLCMVMG